MFSEFLRLLRRFDMGRAAEFRHLTFNAGTTRQKFLCSCTCSVDQIMVRFCIQFSTSRQKEVAVSAFRFPRADRSFLVRALALDVKFGRVIEFPITFFTSRSKVATLLVLSICVISTISECSSLSLLLVHRPGYSPSSEAWSPAELVTPTSTNSTN